LTEDGAKAADPAMHRATVTADRTRLMVLVFIWENKVFQRQAAVHSTLHRHHSNTRWMDKLKLELSSSLFASMDSKSGTHEQFT
jgi:hypothetical protein